MTVLNDGLESLKTGLGKKSGQREYKDYSRKNNKFWLKVYRNSWLAEKFIDKTAKDMTKKWRSIKTSSTESSLLKDFEKLEDKYKISVIAEEALIWGALFGEVLIVSITDAHEELYSSELQPNENIKRFIVIDDYQLGDIDADIFSPNFGNPKSFKIKGNGNDIELHYTRAHRLVVGKVPFSERSKNGGKGVSDLQSKLDSIMSFDAISTSVSDLIEDSKIDILKMPEFNSQLAAGQEDKIIKVVQIVQQIKSMNNMILLDKDDDYEQKEITFSGLADLWVKAREVIAGGLLLLYSVSLLADSQAVKKIIKPITKQSTLYRNQG